MDNKKYNILFNKKIDGTLTAAEEEQLSTYLNNSSNARQELADLEKSMKMIDTLQEVDPPERLKENILASIDHSRYMQKTTAARKSWWSWTFMPSPRIGLAFTAGLLIGLMLVSVFMSDDLTNTAGLYGTMGLPEQTALPATEQINLDNEQASGTINIYESAGMLILESRMQSKLPALQVTIEYDPLQLSFVSYTNKQQTALQLKDDIGRLTLQAGTDYNAQLLFDKRASTAALNITISSAHQTLLNRHIKLNTNKN